MITFLIFKVFKHFLKIRDSSLIEPFALNLLLKILWFYLPRGGGAPTPLLHWRRWRNAENGRGLRLQPSKIRHTQVVLMHSFIKTENFSSLHRSSALGHDLTRARVAVSATFARGGGVINDHTELKK